MSKKLKTALLIVLSILISPIVLGALLFLFVVLLWFAMYMGGLILCPNPDIPDIKYGEFPFELVYEIDGKVTTINDIYVCEYDGVGLNEASKYVKWKAYLKSNGGDPTVLLTQVYNVCVYASFGSPETYMGEYKLPDYEVYEPLTLYKETLHENGITTSAPLSEYELLEQYGIKIIYSKFSSPIVNSFS